MDELIHKMKIGDLVIIPSSGPIWRVVPASEHDGVDVILAKGITVLDQFYRDARGRKIVRLEQDRTGDETEITEDDVITQVLHAFVMKGVE